MRHSKLRAVAVAAALVVALAGCESSETPDPDQLRLSGSIYTDFHVDAPCAEQRPPPELTGVELTFKDPTGKVLGTALSGLPDVLELPKGPGTETWAHGGCRVFAPYAAILPLAESYSVDFKPSAAPRAPNQPYFEGVDQIEPQTATMAELASRGFRWDFEAPPAFVVP
jgi:hypothetical protein